jgi:hypothetical protein
MAAILKVDNITSASNTGTANLTLDASGNATVGGMVVPASSFKRNKLINGSMNVYQRGSVNATTSGAYTLDRWFVTPTGATVTVTQSTSTVPTNFTASLNVAGAASVTNVSAYQRIESINCQELVSGAKVTVSGYIYQSTGSAVTTATVALTTPTASDNYTSTSSAATTYTIPSFASATWTYFNNTFTLTTGCTNGLQVTIALGTSLTTGSLNLTGVQLEVGSVATPYERQIYSDQLAQCQRFYTKSYDIGVVPGTANPAGNYGLIEGSVGAANSTSSKSTTAFYPVAMRNQATVTLYDIAGNINKASADNIGGYTNNQAAVVYNAGERSFGAYMNTGINTATLAFFYTASAEL